MNRNNYFQNRDNLGVLVNTKLSLRIHDKLKTVIWQKVLRNETWLFPGVNSCVLVFALELHKVGAVSEMSLNNRE